MNDTHPIKRPMELFIEEQVHIVDRRDANRARADWSPLHPVYEPVGVTVPNVWVCASLTAQWTAAYRLASQDGRLIVAELRVYPAAEALGPGEWRGQMQGIQARAPRGGLTATVLKRVRVGAHVTEGRHVLQGKEARARGKNQASSLREWLRRHGVEELEAPAPGGGKSGRRGKPLEDCARIAAAYAEAISRGSRRPEKEAARALHMSPSTVRDRIFRARRLGVLTPTSQGRLGGTLTELGRAVLATTARPRSQTANE